jgi:hypothetical protein
VVFVLTLYLFRTFYLQEEIVDTWIIINGDGDFVPSEVSIEPGMIIGWRNEGIEYVWPASNLHPSHSVYPEFDPLEPIAPGGVWSFKFDKIGDWRFHDHLRPVKTGVVNVE